MQYEKQIGHSVDHKAAGKLQNADGTESDVYLVDKVERVKMSAGHYEFKVFMYWGLASQYCFRYIGTGEQLQVLNPGMPLIPHNSNL